MRRAITLVELLICIAIIMVLAGLIFPVMSAARFRAAETADISKMRQLGAASEVYCQDGGLPYLLDLAPLVLTKAVPDSILSSSNDRSRLGYHHAWRDSAITFPLPGQKEGLLWGHRVSFATPTGTYGVTEPKYRKWLGEDPTAGWLVNMSRAVSDGCDVVGTNEAGRDCGSYHRLLHDGSVQFRKSTGYSYRNGSGELITLTHHLFNFTDRAGTWIEEFHAERPSL